MHAYYRKLGRNTHKWNEDNRLEIMVITFWYFFFSILPLYVGLSVHHSAFAIFINSYERFSQVT